MDIESFCRVESAHVLEPPRKRNPEFTPCYCSLLPSFAKASEGKQNTSIVLRVVRAGKIDEGYVELHCTLVDAAALMIGNGRHNVGIEACLAGAWAQAGRMYQILESGAATRPLSRCKNDEFRAGHGLYCNPYPRC